MLELRMPSLATVFGADPTRTMREIWDRPRSGCRQIWLLGLWLALSLALTPVPGRGQSFQRSEFDNTNILIQEAVNHIYQRRYQSAFDVLRRAYEQSPRNAQVHFNLGRLYELTGNYSQSQQSYQLAVVLDPSMIAARRGLARVGVEIKRQMVMARTEAMDAARAAAAAAAGGPVATPGEARGVASPVRPAPVVTQPARAPAMTSDASAARQRDQTVTSVIASRGAPQTPLPTLAPAPAATLPPTTSITLPPLPTATAREAIRRPTSAAEQRGEAALDRGDARAAVAELETARAADPDNPRLLALLGRAHSQLGDLFEAIKFLEESLRIDENNLGARLLLAQNYGKVNLLDEALRNYRQYYEIKPSAATALEIAGLYEKMGRPEDARNFYARAQSSSPASPGIQRAVERADTAVTQRLYIDGLDAFRRADWRTAERLLRQAVDARALPPTHQQDAVIKLEAARIRLVELEAREKPARQGFVDTRRIYASGNLRYPQLLEIPFKTRFSQPVQLEWRGFVAREVRAVGQRFLLMIKELSRDELDEMQRDRNDYQLNPHFKGQPLFLLKEPAGGFPPFARPGAMITFSAKTDYQSFEVLNDLGQRVRLPSLELLSAYP